jgi:hypothetical protein
MRRKGSASYEAAKEYLEQEYPPAHNRRFARPPAQPEDYHGRKPTARELRQIFRLETERTISNDWVIRHEGRSLQLQPRNRRYGPTKSKGAGVRVGRRNDGGVLPRGADGVYRNIRAGTETSSTPGAPTARVVVVRKAKKDHPWQQSYKSMKPWLRNRGIAAPLVGIRTSASP